MTHTLLDEIEPSWHVHEYHETTASASPETVFQAMMGLPVEASMLMRLLMGVRRLPALLAWRGRTEAQRPHESLIDAMQHQGFAILANRPAEEIVLGIAGWFWQAAPVNANLRGREDFLRYDEPGSARASINFRVEPIGGRTRLSTETRVRCFGDAERKFRLYWAAIGPFSAWIRRDWLRLIKHASELRPPGHDG